jgi:hypothetical protein
VHLLPLDEEGLVDRVVVALPERVGVVADVAESRSVSRGSYLGSSAQNSLDRHQPNTC